MGGSGNGKDPGSVKVEEKIPVTSSSTFTTRARKVARGVWSEILSARSVVKVRLHAVWEFFNYLDRFWEGSRIMDPAIFGSEQVVCRRFRLMRAAREATGTPGARGRAPARPRPVTYSLRSTYTVLLPSSFKAEAQGVCTGLGLEVGVFPVAEPGERR